MTAYGSEEGSTQLKLLNIARCPPPSRNHAIILMVSSAVTSLQIFCQRPAFNESFYALNTAIIMVMTLIVIIPAELRERVVGYVGRVSTASALVISYRSYKNMFKLVVNSIIK